MAGKPNTGARADSYRKVLTAGGGRGIGIALIAFAMTVFDSLPIFAQVLAPVDYETSVTMRCNTRREFQFRNPEGMDQPQTDPKTIRSADPTIAQGVPGFKGGKVVSQMGTQGQIGIVAGSKEGDTTIEFEVETFSGARKKVRYKVHVRCPKPERQPTGAQPPPPPKPQGPPPAPRQPGQDIFQGVGQLTLPTTVTFTHRTSCQPCNAIARQLNAAIDAYGAAYEAYYKTYVALGGGAGRPIAGTAKQIQGLEKAVGDVNRARGEIDRLAKALDDCEREKCAPPVRTSMYLDTHLLKNLGRERKTERDAFTDRVTNEFSDSGDPLGVGIGVGYDVWINNIVVGAFGSFDYLKQTINHTFPTGSFFGSTTHWIGTVAGKLGTLVAPNVTVYGIAGASFLNEDLNINFGGPFTSNNVTLPGFTTGVGAEFQPSLLQGFGLPVSMFLQYQHTWWQEAHLDRPLASPSFNYTFHREDDTIRLGLKFYLNNSTEPPRTPVRLITK